MTAYNNHLYVEAVSWFEKAAEQGNEYAIKALKVLKKT